MKIEITPEELEMLLNTDPDGRGLPPQKEQCEHPAEHIMVKKFYVCLKCSQTIDDDPPT